MKRSVLLLVLFVLVLPVYLVSAKVEPPNAAQAIPDTTPDFAEPHEFLISLPPPQKPIEFDGGWRNSSPDQLLQAAAEQQAQPVLAELRQLQSRGDVLGFSLDPEQFAVRVWTTGEFPRLDTGTGAIATAEAGLPACSEGLAEAVVEMSRTSSMARELAARTSRAKSDAPSIDVRITAPYIGEYSYVSGYAKPDSSITMRIYRNGSLYQEWYNSSDSDGFYQMYPYWVDCPNNGYVWYIRPGDIVEIEDDDGVTRTTVVPLAASLDPIALTAEGLTAPNRTIDYIVVYPDENDEWWSIGRRTQSDAGGRFNSDLEHDSDQMSRRSFAIFYVLDGNGNTTTTFVNAFSINIGTNADYVSGTVNRGATGTAKLFRGGQQIDTSSFVADPTGDFFTYFDNETPIPGDVITVQDGKQTISTTIAPANFKFDVAQDRLIGTTASGRMVEYNIYGRYSSSGMMQNSCDYRSEYDVVFTGSNGAVNVALEENWRPGDYGYTYIYDLEGNTQNGPRLIAPTLVAGPGAWEIGGYWSKPYVNVNVRVYDSGNNLKLEENGYPSYDGQFRVWINPSTAAGDRIVVSDGVDWLSMIVQNLNGRLDSSRDRLALSGPDMPFLATFTDYDGFNYNAFDCYERSISGGSHQIALDGRVDAGDYATVYALGADGNYSKLDLSAFRVVATPDDPYVFVRTETPNGEVRLIHRRNGVQLDDLTAVAGSPGYIWFYLSNPVKAGDQLKIDGLGSEAGSSADLKLPHLTYSTDINNDRVEGSFSPSGAFIPVKAWMWRQTNYSTWGVSGWSSSNENGIFSIWFWPTYMGGYWREPCKLVGLDDRCVTISMEYLLGDGHLIQTDATPPPPAPPDAFETDDTAAAAKAYAGGTQTHTFHTQNDVDWIKVNIPAWAVGRPVHLVVHNMGWGVGVDMGLYLANGATPVNADVTDSGEEIRLSWQPDAAGTYLLRAAPQDEYAAGDCDSFYDFRIDFAWLSLPAVMR